MQEEATSAFSVDNILKQVGEVVQAFVALPSQASRLLAQMESGALVVQSPQVTREVRTLGRAVDRLTGGVIFSAFLVSGVMVLNNGNGQFGGGLLGAAGATFFWILFAGRSRK
ncbi:MAG: hypothetical protein IPL71_07570 [Anaerolineales bacterium]|uniref:hypothetical protein n=1 Tax=Candidatus Villigracilis proximus TaxID=3140683 RepID=UPI003136EFBD|nr:hypothetical protein [Anaerolineales bacterium]